jgi:hypothetical protein
MNSAGEVIVEPMSLRPPDFIIGMPMCFSDGAKSAGELATMALEEHTAAVVVLQLAGHRVLEMPHVKTNLIAARLLATPKAAGHAPVPNERTEYLPLGAIAEQISTNLHSGGGALEAAAASKP